MSTDFYFFTARANGCDIYLFNKNIYALTAQRCSKYNKVNINYIHFLNKKKIRSFQSRENRFQIQQRGQVLKLMKTYQDKKDSS